MPSPKFVVLGFSGRSIFIDSLKGVLNDKLRRLVKFVPVMCIEFIIWQFEKCFLHAMEWCFIVKVAYGNNVLFGSKFFIL